MKKIRAYKKPRRFDTNVTVIGAGSAGLVASLIVAGAKAKVALIEKHKMGGDCLNTGCVPSKSLLRSGRVMADIRRAEEFGIVDAAGKADFGRVMARVQDVIKTIEPHDSVERFTSLGVECISGEAFIESPWTVRVGERRINSRAIILATGARPLVPSLPGLDEVPWLTSDTVWSLHALPRRLLVVGGGPIGCEMAQAFSNLGAEVTLLELAPRLLPREDPEVSELMMARFAAEGIRVLTGHKLLRFACDHGGCDHGGSDSSGGSRSNSGGSDKASRSANNSGAQFFAEAAKAEQAKKSGKVEQTEQVERAEQAGYSDQRLRLDFDKVLLALGRKPNVEGFGLEELQMPLSEHGGVQVNAYMQTAYRNIFACGDVAGPYQFTHLASYQAWFAALNALLGGLWRVKGSYRVVPWATFTEPEVARVGLSEEEAKAQGIPYEVTRYDLAHHDRALADGEPGGFVKVLTAPGKDKILGCTIVGHRASDTIGEFVLAMTHNLGLKHIAAATHIYPTMLEANKFAANTWRNTHLPQKFFPLLQHYFHWQRR